MPRALNIGFWSLIAILIAFNIFRFYKKDWNYADPIDYRGLFLGSQMMEAKENLYNDSVAAEIWLAHKKAENFEINSDFGDRWVSISSLQTDLETGEDCVVVCLLFEFHKHRSIVAQVDQ